MALMLCVIEESAVSGEVSLARNERPHENG